MSYIREYGITKVVLVVIMLIAVTFLASFVLGRVVDHVLALCVEKTPYLACNYSGTFFSGLAGIVAVFLADLFSFQYLVKLSMVRLAVLTVFVLASALLSTWVLKYFYEQSTETK